MIIQSDLAYPVLFYPDPSPAGRKSLVTGLQHMPCIHTVCVCSIIRFPRLSGFFFRKTDALVKLGLPVVVDGSQVYNCMR